MSKFEPPIDIKTAPDFKKMREVLKARKTEVAKLGARPGVNASDAVSAEDVQQAFEAGALGRGSPRALVATVHYVLMTGKRI